MKIFDDGVLVPDSSNTESKLSVAEVFDMWRLKSVGV
jgi:hypothetical protein